jgi:DNA-binding transcriptional regulator LsrR (DeoR family)
LTEDNEVHWFPSSKNFKGMKLISQPPRERRLMVRCLELYYRQARPQKEIARALGVSAATVSRLLKRAYDDGFVRVELDLPRAEELEAALTERFGLRDAVVVRLHALPHDPPVAGTALSRPRRLPPLR